MDWLTHIGIALLIAFLFKLEKKSFFLMGSLLPDLFGKSHYLLKLFYGTKNVTYLSLPAHTFLGIFLLSVAIAWMFRDSKRKFTLLVTGSILHLFLDMVVAGQVLLLMWPFSWAEVKAIPLITVQTYHIPMISTYLIISIYLIAKRKEFFRSRI